MFTPLGLDHVVFRVRDQAAAQRFYVDLLGCTVDHVNERISLIHLRFGESTTYACRSAATISTRSPPPCASGAWRSRATSSSAAVPMAPGRHSIYAIPTATSSSSSRAGDGTPKGERTPGDEDRWHRPC
jgi:catechol 2,3-dioxygenase-like lactoylglutathione lyase family enzyme